LIASRRVTVDVDRLLSDRRLFVELMAVLGDGDEVPIDDWDEVAAVLEGER